MTPEVKDLIDLMTGQIEKVYQRFIFNAGIEHTRLSKIGFMGIMHELVSDDPFPNAEVQAGVLKYVESALDEGTDGLKYSVQEHMIAAGQEYMDSLKKMAS